MSRNILFDFNQIAISNLMVQTKGNPDGIEKGLLQHMIFNSLRATCSRHRDKNGKVFICCESCGPTWRKEFFPPYKQNRVKTKDKSEHNWSEIYEAINEAKEIIREHFPYSVVSLPGAEADDIIAILAKDHSPDNSLIVSGDKDFQQLQQYFGVQQYDPVRSRWIECNDPEAYLYEHVLKGDSSDGIPNFLSDDEVFLTEGMRQSPLRKKKLAFWAETKAAEFGDPAMNRNYDRNRRLIDFEYIPQEIQVNAREEISHRCEPQGTQYSVFKYLAANGFKELAKCSQEF